MATDATDLKHCNNSFKGSKTNHVKQCFGASVSETNSNAKFGWVAELHMLFKDIAVFVRKKRVKIYFMVSL